MIKKKIAVLLNSFWIHGKGMTGGDQMAMQIFSHIESQFQALTWYSNSDGLNLAAGIVGKIEKRASFLWFDKLPVFLCYILRTFLLIFKLSRREHDIIYAGSDFFPDVIPAYLYKKRYPEVVWVQCVFHIYPNWRSRPGNRLINFGAGLLQQFSIRLIHKADRIVTINQDVMEELCSNGLEEYKIEVISPGIDFGLISRIPKNKTDVKFDAVFLGRMSPSKGIYDIPDIWAAVIKAIPDARIALIGNGDPKVIAELEKKIASCGCKGNIVLLGFCDATQVYSILKSADIFLFPSYEEGFGIAIVEALACDTKRHSLGLACL
jgi:glycosyltransferase involved in cell wall biosynthesis